MNDIELYMSIQLADPAGAFCWIDLARGLGHRKLVPTFVASWVRVATTFFRRQALDALSFGVAQKEALACLYLIEEAP